MHEIVVGPRAIADLLDLYLFGIERFGPLQANRCRAELDEVFDKLGAFPHMGRAASGMGDGVRRHEHGSHVIFYRENGETIFIARIIHARSVRDLER
ncbi:type II toxin-antitoxin system RelE/ParE family toxin [Aliihoeflea sp. PC F10.4]